MNTVKELCPAARYDTEEERVICIREESVLGAWCFICSSCFSAMLDGKARREEWKVK